MVKSVHIAFVIVMLPELDLCEEQISAHILFMYIGRGYISMCTC